MAERKGNKEMKTTEEINDILEGYEYIKSSFDKVIRALEDAPYRVANNALYNLEQIRDHILDGAGEVFGGCESCGRDVFIRLDNVDDYYDDPDGDCKTCIDCVEKFKE